MRKKAGYGVLDSDAGWRDRVQTSVNFDRNMESRLCLPSPNGDGSVLTLVSRLSSNGTYEFIVEDEQRNVCCSLVGNIFTNTVKEVL